MSQSIFFIPLDFQVGRVKTDISEYQAKIYFHSEIIFLEQNQRCSVKFKNLKIYQCDSFYPWEKTT